MLNREGAETNISIHALREEGDVPAVGSGQPLPISIHALREEGDRGGSCAPAGAGISIHALREEGDSYAGFLVPCQIISIHALREEGDTPCGQSQICILNFYPRPPRGGRLYADVIQPVTFRISIHALREEGDASGTVQCNASRTFLSTPSARRATYQSIWAVADTMYFYPRPPRGGRQLAKKLNAIVPDISIHALREEGDCRSSSRDSGKVISIHALREEGDISGISLVNHTHK